MGLRYRSIKYRLVTIQFTYTNPGILYGPNAVAAGVICFRWFFFPEKVGAENRETRKKQKTHDDIFVGVVKVPKSVPVVVISVRLNLMQRWHGLFQLMQFAFSTSCNDKCRRSAHTLSSTKLRLCYWCIFRWCGHHPTIALVSFHSGNGRGEKTRSGKRSGTKGVSYHPRGRASFTAAQTTQAFSV